MLLLDFKVFQMLKDCDFQRTLKAHLMIIKAKDGTELLQVVDYYIPKNSTERGMVYYTEEHDEKALTLLHYREFLNKLLVV